MTAITNLSHELNSGEEIGKLCPVEVKKSIPRIARFEKVSYEQFKKDLIKHVGEWEDEKIMEIYNNIKLPKRSSTDSAGYDFFAPFKFHPNEYTGIVIPTGVRCWIDTGWVLGIYPRSGLGFRSGMHLFNTVGIIDGDYYYTDCEGHILVKVASKLECDFIEQGKGFCQGIFTMYGITQDDEAEGVRTGGFGSSDIM